MSSDYVIIGSGLCGTVLAARLSENPDVTVTVLEAGSAPFRTENIDVPALLLNNLGNPDYDWAFFSTPQKNLGDRPVFLPRGKGIGGSTLLNFMQHNRASSVEYDALEKLGSKGWTWDSLVPYFKKSESLVYNEEDAKTHRYNLDPNYHGTSGPLRKRVPAFFNIANDPWIEAVEKQGIKHNPDPSSGNVTGVWSNLVTADENSVRSSAGKAYYEPNQSRANLKVISGALGARVLTSGTDNMTATGVEYIKDGVTYTIHATKEVILSAGSYKTPQLLELSGIGDPAILKKFGIEVVVDLPSVGNNLLSDRSLQDHVSATYTVQAKPGLETWTRMEDPAFAKTQSELFKSNGSGMLSGLPVAYAFLPLKDIDEDGKLARLAEKLFLETSPVSTLQIEWLKDDRVAFLQLAGYDRFMPGTLQAPEPGVNYISSSVILLHPFFKGSVHISSNDPTAAPVIDHNYLDNEFDVQVLVEGYKLIRKIYENAPLKDLVDHEVSPGPAFQSDAELAEYAKKVIGSTYHPIATASMLPREDGGVVDERLKVYGTANLRVVDASIFPFEVAAPLQATLYGFAEKAADIIKEDA